MSTIGGSNIVTNGLVLALDAANRRSYVSGSSVWNDISGNRNNGSLVNGPAFDSANGGSIVFDGSNDYSIVSNSPSLNNWTAQTIGVWFTFSTLDSQYIRLIEKGANDEWTIGINYVSSDYKLFLQQLGSTSLAIKSLNALNDNKYHYAIITIDSSQYCSMYIDGILNGQFQSSVAGLKTGDVNIGRYGGGGYHWKGNIAIVQIYNRTLSNSEIIQNYEALKSRYIY